MKRILSLSFACGLISAAALPASLYAQNAAGNENGNVPQAYSQASKLHYQGRQAKFAAKLKKLGLTDDQVKQFGAAMKAKFTAMKAARKALMADMKTLKGQVESKASDQDIQATLTQLDSDRDAMGAAMKAADAQFKTATSFLTPTQQAELIVDRMGHKRGGRHGWHKKHAAAQPAAASGAQN